MAAAIRRREHSAKDDEWGNTPPKSPSLTHSGNQGERKWDRVLYSMSRGPAFEICCAK